MLQLVRQVRALADGYVRRGGKDNRKQQRARMLKFAEFAASMGAKSLGQVGGRHVVEYWRRHRSLSPSTAYNHWLALCILWELAGKAGKPPRLRLASSDPQSRIGQSDDSSTSKGHVELDSAACTKPLSEHWTQAPTVENSRKGESHT